MATKAATGFNHNLGQINNCYDSFAKEIAQTINDSVAWPTLANIESKYSDMRSNISLLDSEFVSNLINSLDESNIIRLTREKYNNLGIRLKTNVKVPITIQTESIKITINRYVLIPFTDDDKKNLILLENRKSIYPVDEYLGISNLPFKITVNGMLKIAKCAQEQKSFQQASNVLLEYNKIKIDPVTIMKVTNHIGEIVYKKEFSVAKLAYSNLMDGHLILPNKSNNATLYIQIDGAMVNIRRKNNENILKEEKGSSWHENKLALLYTSDDVVLRGREQINNEYKYKNKIENKIYASYIGDALEFRKLVLYSALEHGYGSYKYTVLLSDGAAWIKNLKEILFPNAQHILDFYHLSEKVWDFSKIFYNKNEKKYAPFAHSICEMLKESKISTVQKIIKKMEDQAANKKEIKDINLYHYISNNVNNIDYKNYLKKGFIIGSGGIESANKSVMQFRLKQPGMRWTLESARRMVMLRAIYKSGQWYEKVVIPVYSHYGIKCYPRYF